MYNSEDQINRETKGGGMDSTVRKLNMAEAREGWAEIVNDVAGGRRVVVMRRGNEMAAIVPMTDFETLRAIMSPNAETLHINQSSQIFNFTTPAMDATASIKITERN
jgi:antitoxin (DNA-binding transcriptional repressor) of toxin-antitoxin stability system